MNEQRPGTHSLGLMARIAAHPLSLWAVVTVYLALASLYSAVVPVFEAPDELPHVQYAAYFLMNNHLPDTPVGLSAAGIEATQAPLYYVLSGLAMRAAGSPPPDLQRLRNPNYERPDANRYLPVVFGADGAVRIARLASTIGGALAVVATYVLGRAMRLERACALFAAIFVALLPQFAFVGAYANNDGWAAAAGALVLAAIVWLDRTPQAGARQALLLGVVLGIAALVKSSVLLMAPLVALVLWLRSPRAVSQVTVRVLLFLMGALAGGGWFYLRNLLLYDSWINWNALMVIGEDQQLRPEARLQYFLSLFPQITYRSFVGTFGQVNVFMPDVFYVGFTLLAMTAVTGLWFWLWREHRMPPRGWLWLLAAVLTNLAVLMVWNSTFLAHQGRLLFPTLGAIALLLARGWRAYPVPRRDALGAVVVLGLLSLNAGALWTIVAAYR